jgi:hypothetical protein
MFEKLKSKHKSQYVFRSQVWYLTGGIVAAKTMAILDSRGKGIEDRVIIDKKTAYPIDSFIEWLGKHMERIK